MSCGTVSAPTSQGATMNDNIVFILGYFGIAGATVTAIALATIIGEAIQRYYDR